MSDNTVLKLSQPSTFSDPLTEVLRSGARSLLARAVEAEIAAFLDGHSEARTEEGRRRLVRHGHLPEREIMTGIGPVAVRAPRVRDRTGLGADRIRFSSALLPPYARRSKSLEVLIPVLYLKGISTGDFAEALAALLGPDAGGLSASTVARLTEVWADEHAHWLKRDLSARHYVYFWADGIHVQARLEDDAQCLLVIIGATPEGKKELVGLIDGVRESAQSWRELLLDLKRRGLAVAPELAIADGALGFWKAIEEVWPRTRSQRCWVSSGSIRGLPACAQWYRAAPSTKVSGRCSLLFQLAIWPSPRPDRLLGGPASRNLRASARASPFSSQSQRASVKVWRLSIMGLPSDLRCEERRILLPWNLVNSDEFQPTNQGNRTSRDSRWMPTAPSP